MADGGEAALEFEAIEEAARVLTQGIDDAQRFVERCRRFGCAGDLDCTHDRFEGADLVLCDVASRLARDRSAA